LLVAILHHGSPVLSAASFDQMAPPTEVGVRLARGFGFFSGNEHGHPLIAATGDIEEFHTLLAVFPDLHLGFAVVASSRSGAATTNFFRAVVNACVAPAAAAATIARPSGPVVLHDRTSTFSGLYRTVRYPHHELSKTFVLLDLTHVSARGDGTLYIDGRRYDPAGAGRFRPADGGATVSFVATADGRQFLSRPDSPSLEKIHWWETGWFTIAIYFAALAICLVGLVKTRHLARAICSVALVYSLGWLVTLLLYGADNLILGIPLALRILLFMAWLLPICLFLSLIAVAKLKSVAVRLIPFAIAQLLFIAWYWHVYWP
jgi:hypothetical protein